MVVGFVFSWWMTVLAGSAHFCRNICRPLAVRMIFICHNNWYVFSCIFAPSTLPLAGEGD